MTDDHVTAASTGTDRRRLLREVRDALVRSLTPPLAAQGFEFRVRDAAFQREREGVTHALALGISSRPPSLERVGILVEPALSMEIHAWSADAERRLAVAAGRPLTGEHPSAVLWELLDWLVPGKRPHWILPDEPTPADVEQVGESIRGAVVGVALPFIKRIETADLLLEGVATGELRVIQDARFTIACGALLVGRSDVARTVIEPIGTARRQAIADVLGLRP